MKKIVFSWRYLLLLVWIIILSSCKKDNVNSNAPSRTELLTSAPWKLIALTFHGDWDADGVVDPVDKDLYPEQEAYVKDDLFMFNADGSGTYDNGPDDLDAVPQTTTFSWSFYNPASGTIDENVIKFKNFGFEALNIIELSSTTLKVQNLNNSGFSMYTYSH